MTGHHAYQIRAEDPDGVSVADIRQQVALQLDPYERTLPEQQIFIQRTPATIENRPQHLYATYRFDVTKHNRADITAVATTLLESLPIAWAVLEYHKCPPEQASSGSDCPDWTLEKKIGTPPESI